MSGGGGNGAPDYREEIRYGLQQANLPKSPLAQQYNDMAMAATPSIFEALMNAQNLGSSMFGGSLGGQIPFQAPPAPAGGYQPQGLNDLSAQWDRAMQQAGMQPRSGGTPNLTQFDGQMANFIRPGPGGVHPPPINPGGANNPLGGSSPVQGTNGLQAPQLSQAGFLTLNPYANQLDQNIFQRLSQNVQAPQMNFGQDPFAQIMAQLQGAQFGGGIPQGLNQAFQAPSLNPIQQIGAQQVNAQQVGGAPQINAQQIGQAPQVGASQVNAQQANVANAPLQQALAALVNPAMVQAQQASLGGLNIQNPNLSSLQGQINPQDSEYYNAISQILQNKQQRDIGDLRERFTNTGTSRGTPALHAEALLRAQQAPEIAAALGGVRQSEFANELQRRGLVQQGMLDQAGMLNQTLLGGRGQDLTALLANAQNALTAGQSNQSALLQAGIANQGAGLQAANLNNLYNLQQRGQNVDLALANASNNLGAQQSNQSAGLQAALANAQNFLTGGQANQGANLQAQLANAQNFLQQGGMNQNASLQAMLANAANSLQAGQANQQAGLQTNQQLLQGGLQTNQQNLDRLLGLGGLNQQAGQLDLNRFAQLLQGAQGQGQLNLGQNQLLANTGLQSQDLNTQRLLGALGAQNTFFGNQNQLALGNQANVNQAQQFNAGQSNQFNLATAGMQQAAIESMLSRQFSGLNQLLGVGAGLAASGTPGGSANVNVGPVGSVSGGSSFGQTAMGVGAILSALAAFSDERLKDNIKPLVYGLNTFNWRDTGAFDIGFVAQEVQEVFPDAVVEDPSGYLKVDYSRTREIMEAFKARSV